ncbi:MAG: HAMP domain-containing sensor histidine kinase [Acidobacteriota bacterium]
MKRTIGWRLTVVFAAFAALLGGLFSALTAAVFWRVEDRFVGRQLEASLERYIEREGGEGGPDPLLTGSLYLGPVDDLPLDLARLVPDPEKIGIREIEEADAELHVMVVTHPATLRPVIAVARFSESERTEKNLSLALGAALASTVVFGALLGWRIARRIVAPVEVLQQRLADGARPLAEGLPDDEIGLLAQALDQAEDRRHQALARERLFLREASHELRTPVTVIQGVAELLQDEGASNERRFADRIDRLARSVRRLDATIQSLLAMAREENRRSAQGELPIADQVDDLVEEVRLLLPAEVTIATSLRGEPPTSPLLVVALSNLLHNAIEHTETGTIELELDGEGARVRDPGSGMSPETARSLSDPEAPPGPGLGLPTVHRICRRLGWHFELDSQPDRGTEARISFEPPAQP